MKSGEQAAAVLECVVVQQQYQETLERTVKEIFQCQQIVTYVDTQVKVVETVAFVIEDVQNQAKYVGQATVAIAAVCVLKVVGVVLVGVQLVQHVGVVLPLTTGVKHNIQGIAVLFVMLVTIVGKTKHMVAQLTVKV